MKHFVIILTFFFVLGCKNIDDAKKVTIGMTANELKYVMGEPFDIEIEPNGKETWFFSYRYDWHNNGMHVDMQNNKVVNFYSY